MAHLAVIWLDPCSIEHSRLSEAKRNVCSESSVALLRSVILKSFSLSFSLDILSHFTQIVRLFKRDLIIYQRVLQDERTPTFREVASSFGYRLLVYAVRFDTRLHP